MAKNKVLFQLSRQDVVECLRNLDLPYLVDAEATATDDFLEEVKKGLEWGLECWSDVMKEAVLQALENREHSAQQLLIPEGRR